MPKAKRFQKVRILYDGECPFCAAYVRMARLKAIAGEVDLLDARQNPDLVALHAQSDRHIDEGMVVEIDDVVFFGGEAIWAINTLLSPNPVIRIFSSKAFLNFIYPALRAIRNVTVRLLGHSLIQAKS